MIHSVRSSRSAASEKLSLPWMVRPPSSGVLVSSTTSTFRPMVTCAPAAGTLPPAQMDASDQRPLLTASCATAPADRKAEASRERRNQALRMTPPHRTGNRLTKSPRLAPRALFSSPPGILAADDDAGLHDRRTDRRFRIRGHDQLDPQRVLVLEVRRLFGGAQGIEAVLLHAGIGLGKTRQFEDQPGVLVH